jgi:predicted DNA-binding transcriptional regulator AlpA
MKANALPRHSEPATAAPEAAPVPRLLWGWQQVLDATGIPRRTLERERHRSFPKPVRHVGRRPYWKPEDVVAWAQGGGR